MFPEKAAHLDDRMPLTAFVRVSQRLRMLSTSLLFILFLLVSNVIADQTWPLPEEVSASLIHEIPVLHTAFVQIGEELHYFNQPPRPDQVQHLPIFDNLDPKGNNLKNAPKKSTFNVMKLAGKGKLPLEMDPPMMDFGQNAVGTAQRQKIYIRNMKDEEISLDAVVVNSIEFQASYFDKNKLKKFEMAALDVVFLPREIGKRSAIVHFHTSVGMFTYKVQGNCVSNPYRIPPFAGYRVPLNSTVTKPIVLFNPHPYTMRVTEIGTSGGNAHLDLPHQIDPLLANEPPQYWDIRPYQSKHVATLAILGHTSENTTVYVRIAAELHITIDLQVKQQLPDIFVTVPIEIVKHRGVYAFDELLDFGLIRQGERSAQKFFSVAQYQIGGRLEFESLYVDRGDHTPLYMEFTTTPPIVIYPASKNIVTLGPKVDLVKVHIEGKNVHLTGNQYIKTITGNIIAVSRGGNYNVSLPYRVEVFRGELVSIGNDLSIQEDLRPPHQRVIRLENQLPFGVAVWNISLAPELIPHFSVRLVSHHVPIRSGHIAPVFVLKYNKRVPASLENSTIYVHTNVSTFNVNLYTYTGKMNVDLTSVDKNAFDFGYVQRNDTRTIRFIVWNDNNAELRLKNLAIPHRNAYRLYEVGTKNKGNFSDIRNDERVEYVEPTDVDIPAMKGKIFDLELKVPFDGAVQEGNVLFETDFESKLFAMTYQVSNGVLQSFPDEVSFGETFPSKMVYRSLQVFNSFTEDMTVTRITTLNQDPRFFFEGFDPENPPVLRSGRLTNLGRIIFSPAAPCEHEYCYLGMPLGSTDGAWFIHGLGLPSNLPEIDSYLYKNLRRKYEALVKSGKHHVNTTIILDTNKAKNIKIKTSAELVWPRLLTRNSIHFPLTALGNFTIVNLTLSNPTQVPVAIQVIPLVIYPDAESLVELMRPHLASDLTEHVEMNETLMFSLRDTELFTLKPDSPVPKLREAFEHHLNHDMSRYNGEINIPRFTLSMILRPNTKVRLRLGFLPSDYTLRSSLLLIRNNLTGIEPVVMYGKGARIGVRVEGAEARSRKPLLFEIRHDHLTDCNNPKRLMHKLHSTLTVRRPFQVMNNGEVQFTVTNMSINGVPCENRGFRILNCYPFKLMPNETYALDIAYTPDFLTTTNEADLQLYMHMNGSAWLFPLAATVPGDMLAKCHQALPRPPFENIMYYSCVTALIFCLVCVLACAYLEGDRAIACAIRQQFAVPRHVFDLNNLKPTPSPAVAAAPAAPPAPEKSEAEKKKWRNSTPSTLRASSDAWLISRFLINCANWVVKTVHLVWRWSLFYRKEKEKTAEAKQKQQKKKTPVTMKKEESPEPKETKEPKEPKDTKKATRVEELRQMLDLIESEKTDPEKWAEMEEELAEMWATTRKASSQTQASSVPEPEPPMSKSQKKKKKNAQNNNVKAGGTPKESPKPSPKPKVQPRIEKVSPPKKTEKVEKVEAPKPPAPKLATPVKAPPTPRAPAQAPLAPPPTENSPDLFYRQFLSSFGNPTETTAWDWDSPAAQAAMPFMNLWNYAAPLSVEQMESLIRQANGAPQDYGMLTDSTTTPSEPADPQWRGVGLEEENAEEAPDWVDEEVNASDAEMDFSSMAAASKDIFQEDEAGLRRRRSPSQASSTLSRRLENSPQKMGGRRLTIGSEMKNEFSRTPGASRLPDPPVFPTAPLWSDTATSSGGGGANILNPWSAAPVEEENDPLSLSHLGINLAEPPTSVPLFGNTMFSGPEFNLWSSGSIFQPPPPSQVPHPDDDDDDNDEKA